MAESIIYIFCVLVSVFAISGINFNNFFKVNHLWEARVFVVVLSFIMGYLLGQFIITFLDASKLLM